jgi:hypothetical protein
LEALFQREPAIWPPKNPKRKSSDLTSAMTVARKRMRKLSCSEI